MLRGTGTYWEKLGGSRGTSIHWDTGTGIDWEELGGTGADEHPGTGRYWEILRCYNVGVWEK